ncbi:MAG: hypothetical protein HY332_25120 [Chloroflexi bacterium]|nr:hypothetical protein [Chloroflexota bacterium]
MSRARPLQTALRSVILPAQPLDVILLFDVEDIFSPPEVGNDDSIKELATILVEEGLRGTFLYIGDRALLLRERRRDDVIAAMAPHEVGLHTRSARHLCSPEYVQRNDWDQGLVEALRHEREGVEIIRDVFGKPACALSTHNVFATPHSQRAAAILGLPYVYAYPAAPPYYSVSWYAGALGFPWASPTLGGQPFRAYFAGFDDRYPDTPAFDAHLVRLDQHIDTCLNEGQRFLSLFLYHPQRLRLAEFIDRYWSPNGVNYPPEQWGRYGTPSRYTPSQVATSLANFRRLARWIRNDPRLDPMTVTEAVRRYGSQPDTVTRDDLLEAAQSICAADEILLHTPFSPAEVLVALARAVAAFATEGALPATVPRLDALGPVRNLIVQPEAQGYTWDMIVRRGRELLAHVDATGHLPAMLGDGGERVGANHLYRALAEAYVAIRAGTTPPEVRLRPMPRYPQLAVPIGLRFLQAAEGHVLDPNLDVDALYRHGKLQTWTLKPATIRPG